MILPEPEHLGDLPDELTTGSADTVRDGGRHSADGVPLLLVPGD